MSEDLPDGPVLFCFDGSEGSRAAMRAAGILIARPADAVVLTVWETIETRLALAGAFAAESMSSDLGLDEQEESYARSVAEEGALRAGEHGYKAVPMATQSTVGIATAILATADEVSARLIVCGQRGRGALRAALLGSVSHTLASHTRHPVLIAPEASPAQR
jgi:nucleotide-binding universal stress UspA family protein